MKWEEFKIIDIKATSDYALATGPFGSSIGSQYFQDEGIPVIRGSNLSTEVSTRLDEEGLVFISEELAKKFERSSVKKGDLIFTCWGTINQIGLIDERATFEKYIVSNKQMKLTPNTEVVSSLFLYYYFSRYEVQQTILSSNIGSSVPGFNLGQLKEFRVQLPPLPTQQKIASILSAYDDLIDNNLKRIRLLEEAAQNLYREWFVKFRFPGWEEVGMVNGLPEGWGRTTLGELCNLTMGQSPSSDFYNENGEGLPFHQGVTNYGDRFVSHKTYCTNETRIADEGDILCSVRAPVGRLNVTLDKIIIGRGLSAIRNKADLQSFQFYQLKNHFVQEDMIGGGTIFSSVTKKELESQLLVRPSKELMKKFEWVCKPIDEQIKTLNIQNQKLKEARDILLPRLMNGTIEI